VNFRAGKHSRLRLAEKLKEYNIRGQIRRAIVTKGSWLEQMLEEVGTKRRKASKSESKEGWDFNRLPPLWLLPLSR